jgi:hypothetical protein
LARTNGALKERIEVGIGGEEQAATLLQEVLTNAPSFAANGQKSNEKAT